MVATSYSRPPDSVLVALFIILMYEIGLTEKLLLEFKDKEVMR